MDPKKTKNGLQQKNVVPGKNLPYVDVRNAAPEDDFLLKKERKSIWFEDGVLILL